MTKTNLPIDRNSEYEVNRDIKTLEEIRQHLNNGETEIAMKIVSDWLYEFEMMLDDEPHSGIH